MVVSRRTETRLDAHGISTRIAIAGNCGPFAGRIVPGSLLRELLGRPLACRPAGWKPSWRSNPGDTGSKTDLLWLYLGAQRHVWTPMESQLESRSRGDYCSPFARRSVPGSLLRDLIGRPLACRPAGWKPSWRSNPGDTGSKTDLLWLYLGAQRHVWTPMESQLESRSRGDYCGPFARRIVPGSLLRDLLGRPLACRPDSWTPSWRSNRGDIGSKTDLLRLYLGAQRHVWTPMESRLESR